MPNTETLVSYLNSALLYLFIAVLVILFLSFWRGWLRGWKYGTYRTISFVLFIILGLATLRPLANFIGNFDLSSWGLGTISIPIDLGNGTSTTIASTFGSSYHVLSDLISQAIQATNASIEPEVLANYALALAQSVLMLALIIVEGILLSTIINLLIMLMWHIAWKHTIPKAVRKASYHKHRWISALEEVFVTICCLCMMFYPLTSMVNAIANGFNRPSDETSRNDLRANDETYKTVSSVVDAYNDSLFAKTFFAWTKASGSGESFDTALTGWLTTGDYNGAQVSVVNELQSFTRIGSLAWEGGLFSQKGMTAEQAVLFAVSDYAPELLRAIGSSGLLTKLMPYALEVASNLPEIAKYLQTADGIDYTRFDYAKTFDKLAELYQDVLDSGFADKVVDESGTIVATKDIVKAAFQKDYATPLEDLLKGIDGDELRLLDTLISAAAYNTALNGGAITGSNQTAIPLSDFLPSTSSFDNFVNVQWGHQVAIAFDAIVQLCNDGTGDSRFLDLLTEHIGEKDYSVDTNALTKLLIENADKVGTIIYGDDADASRTCLLDSCFVQYGFPSIMKLASTALNDSFKLTGGDAISLDDVVSELKGDSLEQQTRNVKSEVKALFSVISGIIDYRIPNSEVTPGKAFLSNLEEMPGLYFSPADGQTFLGADPGLLDALAAGITKLDSSKLATAIMPPLFDYYVTQNSAALSEAGFDLSFDFHCPNLGTEMAKMIKAYESSQNVISYLSNLGDTSSLSGDALTNVMKNLASYSSDIVDLLEAIADSAILNPSTNGVKNSNIRSIFKTLMKSLFKDDYSSQIDSVFDETGFSINTEIEAFGGILNAIASSDLLAAVGSFESTNKLSAFSSVNFESLFSTLEQSRIVTKILGPYLDKTLLESDSFKDYLPSDGSVSFANVTNWQQEGRGLDSLIKAANEIGDLSNIDFLNSDPQAISDIIKVLANSQIFLSKDSGGNSVYSFSTYLSKLLIANIKNNGDAASYFADRGATEPYADASFSTLKGGIESLASGTEWSSEADKFASIIRYVQRMGGFTALSGSADLRRINTNDVSGLLDSVSDSQAFGQILTYRFYETINKTLVDAGLSAFENSNLEAIYQATSAERQTENGQLTRILSAVLNPSGKIVSTVGGVSVVTLTYDMLDANGKMKSDINVQTVSADFTLRPILSAMANSRVFNTLPYSTDGAGHKTPTALRTAFEAEIADVLAQSALYGVNDPANNAVLTKVQGIVDSIAPDNVAFSPAQEETRFARWDEEITKVIQVVSDVQSLSLDFEDFDFQALSVEQIALLLKDISASDLLYLSLPYQIKTNVGKYSSSGIDLSNLNADNKDLSGTPSRYDAALCDNLAYILYDVSHLGNFQIDNIADLSSDPLLKNLLEKAAANALFNTPDDATKPTVFESMVDSAVLQSGFYGSASDDNVKTAVHSVIANVVVSYSGSLEPTPAQRYAAWDAVVKQLEAIGEAIPSDLSLSTTDFTSFFTSPGVDSEAQRQKLAALFSEINACEILYPGLPIKLDGAISLLNTGTFDLSGSNVYYKGSHTDGLKLGSASYGADEITTLSFILKDSATIGSAFSTASIGSLSDAQISLASDLLSQLAMSHIFNSTQLPSDDSVFQKNLSTILVSDKLADLYYAAASPKDAAHAADYASSGAKALYVVKENFAKVDNADDAVRSSYDTSLLDGSSGSLKSLLMTLKANSGVIDSFANGSTGSLTSSGIENVLKALNGCVIYQDCVPNLIAKFVTNPDIAIGAVNLNQANPYYCYYFDGTGMVATPDFDRVYSDGEIENLASLIKLVNENASRIQNIASSAIGATDATTLPAIRNILEGFSQSYVFHLAGPSSDNPSATSSLGVPDDLTVFEQTMFMLYRDTYLSARSYSAPYDAAYSDADEKTYALIKDYSQGATSHAGDWSKEITSLVCDESATADSGLLIFLQEQDLLSHGTNVSTTSMNFNTYGPTLLGKLMTHLNALDIVKDAVPYAMTDFLEESLDFKKYSTLTETLSGLSSSSFDSLASIGESLGRYSSVIAVSSAQSTLSYSYDDSHFVALDASLVTAVAGGYEYDLSDLKPTSFTLSGASTITALTYALNTSSYESLSQAQLGGEEGFIATLQSFAQSVYDPALYTGNNGYINFRNVGETYDFLTNEADLSTILALISTPNGAYTQNFYQGVSETPFALAKATSSNYDFASRDIVMTSFLSLSNAGYTLDLGQYLGEDVSGQWTALGSYQGSKAVFTSPSYREKGEAAYLEKYLSTLASSEAVFVSVPAGGHTESFTVSGLSHTVTIRQIHAWMEGLSQGRDASGSLLLKVLSGLSDSSITVSGSVYPSLFAKRFAAGILDRLLYGEKAYVDSNDYLDDFVVVVPSGSGTDRSTVSGYPSVSSFYQNDFASLSHSLELFTGLVRVSYDLGFSALMTSGSFKLNDSALIQTAQSDVLSIAPAYELSSIGKMFYLGTIYDYFLNRGFFHGQNLLLGLDENVDYPNPVYSDVITANGFYNGVAACIA